MNLGALYEEQRKFIEAEAHYQQALTIMERSVGREHPKVALVLINYASLLRKMGRNDEVQKIKARIHALQEKSSRDV